MTTIKEMLNNEYVKVKDLGNNTASLNFSKSAFYDSVWNNITTKARGLFIDTATNEIIARSYNKFFNFEERVETTRDELIKNLKFPVKAFKKENGFLGIMSVDKRTNEVFLASKSQNFGTYQEYFNEIYISLNKADQEQLENLAKEFNCSFVFKVCHIEDRHIIDFNYNHLILLDAIPNKLNLDGVDIDEEFSKNVCDKINFISTNISKKKLVLITNTFEEIEQYVKEHSNDREMEGIVLQDKDGFMFKFKFDYYNKVKFLRQCVNIHRRLGKHHKCATDKIKEFVEFAAALEQTHIIDIVKEYEKLGNNINDLFNN